MDLNLTGFEAAIKQFLDNLASEDPAFAKTYQKPNKSVAECCKYIMQEVEKNRKGAKCVACTDEEVFGLAIHYYDEDNIKVDGPSAKVKVATSATPTVNEVVAEAQAQIEAEKPEKPAKTKRSRKKTTPEVDPDIPDSIEIPLF